MSDPLPDDPKTGWRFDRDAIGTFRFLRADYDPDSGVVRLVYAFDEGPELVETLRIPDPPRIVDPARIEAIERALHLLHLIAGISYFKAAVPERISIESTVIDAETAALLTLIYENGLGEFAYRNGLSLRGRIRFPVEASDRPEAVALAGSAGSLVAIGGGKDSLVSIEALRTAGVAQTVAWIGSSGLIAECARRTGLPTLAIERRLAPELFEFNRLGACNGHIPVTAVNSAILVLAALIHGHDQVVFSNERSASYGSLIPGTGEVNHQWSKGWSFERAFGEYVETRIASGLCYYSLLRPLTELAVARAFARLDRYDMHFSSCNRNFHILGERPTARWCGQCPKCRFVFLALAPFMPKPRLTAIFGRNLLDEPSQAAGYDALIEFGEHKPFECVGEGRESRAAFAALAASSAWREDALVARFAREIAPRLGPIASVTELLHPDGEQRIPEPIRERIDAYFRP
ncbi:MAG TPA: hypothetical protein DDZ76_06740 [Xanthomonadales bacterium]|nr:hypothetical protein [Xanthomonadales bacterium]